MKKKDLIYLLVAAVIFVGAGYLAYTQIFGVKQTAASKTVQVEVVGPITADFNAATLTDLGDTNKTKDFSVTLDLNTGLGNGAIFGP